MIWQIPVLCWISTADAVVPHHVHIHLWMEADVDQSVIATMARLIP